MPLQRLHRCLPVRSERMLLLKGDFNRQKLSIREIGREHFIPLYFNLDSGFNALICTSLRLFIVRCTPSTPTNTRALYISDQMVGWLHYVFFKRKWGSIEFVGGLMRFGYKSSSILVVIAGQGSQTHTSSIIILSFLMTKRYLLHTSL